MSDLRRARWHLKVLDLQWQELGDKRATAHKEYLTALNESLKRPEFFKDYLNVAFDCHATWRLHGKGKYLSLELECEELGYKIISLSSAAHFDVLIDVLESRGWPTK